MGKGRNPKWIPLPSVASDCLCLIQQKLEDLPAALRVAPGQLITQIAGKALKKDRQDRRKLEPLAQATVEFLQLRFFHGTADPVVEFVQGNDVPQAEPDRLLLRGKLKEGILQQFLLG